MPDQTSEKVTVTAADVGKLGDVLGSSPVSTPAPPTPPGPQRPSTTRKIFCSACQKETDHLVTLDAQNEILATCSCGRHIKFPMVSSQADLQKMIDDHKTDNEGQVSAEKAAEQESALHADFNKLMGID